MGQNAPSAHRALGATGIAVRFGLVLRDTVGHTPNEADHSDDPLPSAVRLLQREPEQDGAHGPQSETIAFVPRRSGARGRSEYRRSDCASEDVLGSESTQFIGFAHEELGREPDGMAFQRWMSSR